MDQHSKLNVFLVEDNILYRKALKVHLEESISNIDIQTFDNGEEMLVHMNKNPDVVVLDYMLQTPTSKARNGMSILKKVLLRKPYTPVIILSAQKNKTLITQLVNQGAYDYVAKLENGFERVTNHIRNIVSQLDEERKETKSLWNAMMWTISIVAILCIVLYRINSNK